MVSMKDAFEQVAARWNPESVTDYDTVTTRKPAEFAAIIDQPNPVSSLGDPLPPLWEWFLFLPLHAQEVLGDDGHPQVGPHLPPLPARRRMFGGGRIRYFGELVCGEEVTRISEVSSADVKEGSSGPLLLVTEKKTLSVAGETRVVEERQVVYLAGAPQKKGTGPKESGTTEPVAAPTQPPDSLTSFVISPSPVMLFRFSALTANAHRIHYDLRYARDVEGHRDVLVHGPLSALLLLEAVRRTPSTGAVRTIEWRAREPLYAGRAISVSGRSTGPDSWRLVAGTVDSPRAVTAVVHHD